MIGSLVRNQGTLGHAPLYVGCSCIGYLMGVKSSTALIKGISVETRRVFSRRGLFHIRVLTILVALAVVTTDVRWAWISVAGLMVFAGYLINDILDELDELEADDER